jgi:hypothetical protein
MSAVRYSRALSRRELRVEHPAHQHWRLEQVIELQYFIFTLRSLGVPKHETTATVAETQKRIFYNAGPR